MSTGTDSNYDPNRFRSAYSRDRGRGLKRSLTEYLALFPENEVAVAQDYVAFENDWSESESGGEQSSSEASPLPASGFGPYRLIREIGRGGQGRVYLAQDTKLQRRVAVKLLENQGDSRDLAFARYRREIEALSKIDHPGICPVYDGGIIDGRAYIAMRLIEGRSLRDLLRPHENLETGDESAFYSLSSLDKDEECRDVRELEAAHHIPRQHADVAEMIQLLEKTARALHAAHEAGIAHGDIKPANVMVDSSGRPILLDFGLAGNAEADPNGMTHAAGLHGTPAYMAPELIRSRGTVPNRSTDIYALGVTLFETLTGRRPFQAGNRQALYHAILENEAPRASSLNSALGEELDVVIGVAMQKDPARRYDTALEFAEDLRRIREFEPIQARRATRWMRLTCWCRRNPGLAACLSTIFVLLTFSLGMTTHFLRQEESQRHELAGLVGSLKVEQQKKEAAISALERERQAKEAFFDLAVDLLNKSLDIASPGKKTGIGNYLTAGIKNHLERARKSLSPVTPVAGEYEGGLDLIQPRGRTSNAQPGFEFKLDDPAAKPREVILTLVDSRQNSWSVPVPEFEVENQRVKFEFPGKSPLKAGQAYRWSVDVDGKRDTVHLADGTPIHQAATFTVTRPRTRRLATAQSERRGTVDKRLRRAQTCLADARAVDAIRILEKIPDLENKQQKRMKTFLLGRAYATIGDREKIKQLSTLSRPD